MNQSLAWLYGRQSSPAGNWLGDALLTQGAYEHGDRQKSLPRAWWSAASARRSIS
jgi:hypothetical protein